MPQLQPISNRDFKLPDDGFIQVAPLGEYPNPKAGIVQVLDKEACERMVNRFNEESKAENFPGLLVDFDHMSSSVSTPSTAGGWIEKLENREDGLWAKVRWSTDGEAAVKGGNYRLISPVWNRSECEDLGDNKFRPQRLDRIALTNDPVLRGMTPVSNRAEGTSDNANTVTREEMAAAIAEAVKNAGTSSGAHKGWETRRGALGAFHAKSAVGSRDEAANLHEAARAAGKKGDNAKADLYTKAAQSHEKFAANHEKLAAQYKGKAAVSGAKAHINKQLDLMKKKSGTLPKDWDHVQMTKGAHVGKHVVTDENGNVRAVGATKGEAITRANNVKSAMSKGGNLYEIGGLPKEMHPPKN